ncbi:MAG: oxygen-independent coproporphyrinogen III oxidase-like protein [Proteobacteria bacterium]|nr:MAG: oxygen-independent coproporphyrinogen III oxidase-like protein [Pseudomonadota bacterium]
MFNFAAPPPLSLYIHLPWCVRKCPYCDFNSYRLGEELPEQAYIDALIRDLDQDLPRVWGRRIQSIFLGGGTPSLFSPDSIDALLSAVRARLPFDAESEVTLEANPGTVDLGRFKGFREAGINRLSIGVQSFEEEKLRALGRMHGREEALRAADAARAAGFDNFNLDLMFGLPNQTVEQALADVRTAIDLAPDHLSVYQLTIEPNTAFYAAPPELPDDDIRWTMQQQLQEFLRDNEYQQYEVSAYAREGRRCNHNLNYWHFGDYLGIGAGAHGKISDAEGISRTRKINQPNAYIANAGTARGIIDDRRLSWQDAIVEFMMNALRLTNGFPVPLFQERTGLPISVAMSALNTAQREELLVRGDQTIRPTDRGKRFLNDLLCLFLSDGEKPQSVTVSFNDQAYG